MLFKVNILLIFCDSGNAGDLARIERIKQPFLSQEFAIGCGE